MDTPRPSATSYVRRVLLYLRREFVEQNRVIKINCVLIRFLGKEKGSECNEPGGFLFSCGPCLSSPGGSPRPPGSHGLLLLCHRFGDNLVVQHSRSPVGVVPGSGWRRGPVRIRRTLRQPWESRLHLPDRAASTSKGHRGPSSVLRTFHVPSRDLCPAGVRIMSRALQAPGCSW